MMRGELRETCEALHRVGGVYAWLAGVVWRDNEGACDE